MSVISRLKIAAFGIHFADQIALVAIPIIAAMAFQATPQTIGILVACQSMAHLLGSIPFGILVDRYQLRSLVMLSAILSCMGFALATACTYFGAVAPLGLAITMAGLGVVLFSLSALSIIPKVTETLGLAKANSAIETPRAFCSFAVPLMVGLIIGNVPAWTIFVAAVFGSVLALIFASSLPNFPVEKPRSVGIGRQLNQGGAYVLKHRILLSISLCAIFWNFAFCALLVVLIPALQALYAFHESSFGTAISMFGLAAICGSWAAGKLAARIAPSAILLFGPGSSMLASVGLLFIGPSSSEFWLYLCFFGLGFGPSMWLIVQNSVRQLVTPQELLGKVNSVIQTAIYGVRPFGALVGGIVTANMGAAHGLILVAVCFALAFAIPLTGQLRKIGSYDDLKPN